MYNHIIIVLLYKTNKEDISMVIRNLDFWDLFALFIIFAILFITFTYIYLYTMYKFATYYYKGYISDEDFEKIDNIKGSKQRYLAVKEANRIAKEKSKKAQG